MMPWTHADIDALARTIYGEARGSSQDDRGAVAWTILNRARIAREFVAVRSPTRTRHPLFGTGSIESACKAPWQFSAWNENDPNRAKLLAADFSDPAYLRCLMTAVAAVLGDLPPPFTPETCHYHAKAMPIYPPWSLGKTPILDTGAHLFYAGVK